MANDFNYVYTIYENDFSSFIYNKGNYIHQFVWYEYVYG